MMSYLMRSVDPWWRRQWKATLWRLWGAQTAGLGRSFGIGQRKECQECARASTQRSSWWAPSQCKDFCLLCRMRVQAFDQCMLGHPSQGLGDCIIPAFILWAQAQHPTGSAGGIPGAGPGGRQILLRMDLLESKNKRGPWAPEWPPTRQTLVQDSGHLLHQDNLSTYDHLADGVPAMVDTLGRPSDPKSGTGKNSTGIGAPSSYFRQPWPAQSSTPPSLE